MPFFQYVGDKTGEGHERLDAFGYSFKLKGDPVEVKDEAVASSLRTNSHFKEVEGGAKAAPAPAQGGATAAPASSGTAPAAETKPAAPTKQEPETKPPAAS